MTNSELSPSMQSLPLMEPVSYIPLSRAASEPVLNIQRTPSARDLFAALSTSADSGSCSMCAHDSSRVVSVGDFQRGMPVAPPPSAPPMQGPWSLPQLEHSFDTRCTKELQKAPPVLADGVTTMLAGVQTELGPIITAPVAPCSSFDSLLEALMEQPEVSIAAQQGFFSKLITERVQASQKPGRNMSPSCTDRRPHSQNGDHESRLVTPG